jgi:hypothetical protein
VEVRLVQAGNEAWSIRVSRATIGEPGSPPWYLSGPAKASK